MESSINSSYLPIWLIDLGTIVTIAGFILTVWLLIITGNIRKSFMSKARLGPVIKDLELSLEKLSEHLKEWSKEDKSAIKELSVSRALIANIASKLPEAEKKQCKNFVKIMKQKKHFFSKDRLCNVGSDQAWALYAGLSELTTMLIQLNEDSKWN